MIDTLARPITASDQGDEPPGHVDRPGPRDGAGDGAGTGAVGRPRHLQPLLCLRHLPSQEECSR